MKAALLLFVLFGFVSSKAIVEHFTNTEVKDEPDLVTCVKCRAIIQVLKMVNYEALQKKNKEELKEYLVEKCNIDFVGMIFKGLCDDIKNDGPFLDVIFKTLRTSLYEIYEVLRESTKCPSLNDMKKCD
ncbi:unnamed protein product [Bursaphelenchus okinawaensis]|uniref:Saposin B-type domain-containing protein n=1 Tax=Bursaphelenchus okinawaensis TaxID=465554 RepID=A0A811L3X9_9BILA|nr:unnamed protein product [Bursaphelenchus okinawaensis]CAG9115638.1 unnamed protein product [Bursaphelenchus okinawaensis]